MEYQNEKLPYTKTSISLNNEVMKKIDEFCNQNGLNRSAGIAVLVNQAFQYQEQLKTVADFNKNFDKYMGELKEVYTGVLKLNDKPKK